MRRSDSDPFGLLAAAAFFLVPVALLVGVGFFGWSEVRNDSAISRDTKRAADALERLAETFSNLPGASSAGASNLLPERQAHAVGSADFLREWDEAEAIAVLYPPLSRERACLASARLQDLPAPLAVDFCLGGNGRRQ